MGSGDICWNSSRNDSESETSNVEELIPPEPIAAYIYEVDNHFHLEPLGKCWREPEVVGFVNMDSEEGQLWDSQW